MKKIHKILRVFIGILLAATFVTGGCFVMHNYYGSTDFAGGTWINGMYCAGKTIEEVNAGFIEKDIIQTVTVYDSDGTAYDLDVTVFGEKQCENFAKDGYEYSYEAQLQDISLIQKAEGKNILRSLFRKKEYEIKAEYHATADIDHLVSYLKDTLPIFQKSIPQKQCKVALLKGNEGFYLSDEKEHYLNPQKAAIAIYDLILGNTQTSRRK